MKERYVIHIGSINEEGELSINCYQPYASLSDVMIEQERIIEEWMKEYRGALVEKIGYYKRAFYNDKLPEIQTCIVKIDTI